jgi:RNA-splicing ligase RtcB
MIEECTNCYKDVDEVVIHAEKVGISKNVCRVKPVLVIKS